jgi:hypothetical protein
MDARRIIAILLGTIAVFTVASPAGASAASKVHVMYHYGGEVPPRESGEQVRLGLVPHGEYAVFCSAVGFGEVTTNGRPAVSFGFASAFLIDSRCNEGGTSLSGVVTRVKLASTGVMTAKANLVVGTPGPCTYKVKKISGSFFVGASRYETFTTGSATAIGKLSKKGSAATCEQSIGVPMDYYLSESAGAQWYELEITG